MKTVLAATRTLFPVTTRAPRAVRRSRERSGLLDGVLAISFALTPLLLLIEAVVETA